MRRREYSEQSKQNIRCADELSGRQFVLTQNRQQASNQFVFTQNRSASKQMILEKPNGLSTGSLLLIQGHGRRTKRLGAAGTMTSSSSSSPSSSSYSTDDPDYRAATPDLDDDAATVVLPRQADAAAVVSFLRTQEEVDGVCKKYGVPIGQYTARPAGDLRASSPPPRGAVCVYAHALDAGMRVPLHGFVSEALAHFGIAPTQLAPNGWRIMAGFLALCRADSVPPSLAVFRHFFLLVVLSYKHRGWYCFRSRDTGLRFAGLPHCIKDWKHGFFFLSSATPWACPVVWGEPPKSSFMEPVLTGEEKKWAAKLLRAHGDAPVDLRTRLCDSNLAAAVISPLSPPPSCTPTTSTTASCKGMDPSVYDMMKTMLAEKAAAVQAPASAKKVKTEPPWSSPLRGKKRKLDDAIGEDGPPSSVLPNTPLATHGCSVPTGASSPLPGIPRTPQESTDWQTARKLLQGAVLPLQERVLAASRPSDVVASCHAAILQALNYATFSLGYALDLEKKQMERKAEIVALRRQLEETEGELAAAKRPCKAEQESAQPMAALEDLLESEERVLRRSGHALERYKQCAGRMVGVRHGGHETASSSG